MTGIRVLGLDLSLTATGVCEHDGTTFTIKTRTSDGDKRLTLIRDTIRHALTFSTALAVVEDLPTHAKSAGITGMVHGAARTALMDAGVPYVLVTPATLKKFATGSGNGDKTAMALAAFKRFGLEFSDDNQCDAFWLRAAGLHALGAPLVQLPAAQVAALDKVKWPTIDVTAVSA